MEALTPNVALVAPGGAARDRKGAGLTVVHMVEKTSMANGAVVQALDAARGQARKGHRVVVITRPSQEISRQCRDAGCRHVPMPLWHRFDVYSMRRLLGLLELVRPALIHAHKGVSHAIAVGACWMGNGWPIVVTRGVSFPISNLDRLTYRSRHVRRVIAVCEAVRTVVLESTGLPPDRVVVVYGGTDPAVFNPRRTAPGRVRRELGIPAGVPVVGQVGVRDWKGWQEAMGAMPAVLAAHPKARLLLAGAVTESRRQRVLELATEMGLTRSVVVTTVRRDIPDVLAACDVVLDPSWAGTGIAGTLREAMALAKPVVATAVGGNPELVEHEVSGLLVTPRQHQSLAGAVIRILNDPGFASQLGKMARIRVRRQFSTALRHKRLEFLYRQVIAEAAPGEPPPDPEG